MMRPRHRPGLILPEVLAVLAGLALFGTLVAIAVGAVRQRRLVETASAQLEEAQNLLARWRAGEAIAEPGWQVEVRPHPAGEVLVLHRPGVRLSTVRPTPGVRP